MAFGGVWKESLTELSGGQRSLLALSLVLALCRFKPAPIYILDEVDAALDLNHTQNIGAMIKAHFPQVGGLVGLVDCGRCLLGRVVGGGGQGGSVSMVIDCVQGLAEQEGDGDGSRGACRRTQPT